MDNNIAIPKDISRRMLDPREYEDIFIIERLIGTKRKVLTIGDWWGKNYYHLTNKGKDVRIMDIAPQSHLKNLILGDITRKTVFKDKEFDAVILGEVLEHLFDDVSALKEIRRILKDDGLFILTIPFFNDIPEYHVRIYSPKTIQRLLEHCGFAIIRYIERGGLITYTKWLKKLRSLLKLSCKIVLLLRGLNKIKDFKWDSRFKAKFNNVLAWIDFKLGEKRFFLLKKSKYYGCYITAEKGPFRSFKETNIEKFSTK